MSKKRQARLVEIVAALPNEHATMLLEYAEFLYTRYGVEMEIGEPVAIARPEQESVVKAIKRLSATYPMLNQDKLLNETAAYMMRHMLQGEPAEKIIDELEQMFRTHYEKLRAQIDARKTGIEPAEKNVGDSNKTS